MERKGSRRMQIQPLSAYRLNQARPLRFSAAPSSPPSLDQLTWTSFQKIQYPEVFASKTPHFSTQLLAPNGQAVIEVTIKPALNVKDGKVNRSVSMDHTVMPVDIHFRAAQPGVYPIMRLLCGTDLDQVKAPLKARSALDQAAEPFGEVLKLLEEKVARIDFTGVINSPEGPVYSGLHLLDVSGGDMHRFDAATPDPQPPLQQLLTHPPTLRLLGTLTRDIQAEYQKLKT